MAVVATKHFVSNVAAGGLVATKNSMLAGTNISQLQSQTLQIGDAIVAVNGVVHPDRLLDELVLPHHTLHMWAVRWHGGRPCTARVNAGGMYLLNGGYDPKQEPEAGGYLSLKWGQQVCVVPGTRAAGGPLHMHGEYVFGHVCGQAADDVHGWMPVPLLGRPLGWPFFSDAPPLAVAADGTPALRSSKGPRSPEPVAGGPGLLVDSTSGPGLPAAPSDGSGVLAVAADGAHGGVTETKTTSDVEPATPGKEPADGEEQANPGMNGDELATGGESKEVADAGDEPTEVADAGDEPKEVADAGESKEVEPGFVCRVDGRSGLARQRL